ncbi:MAG: sporulation protein YqfD [Lachnospiraceae bacterium]|nr:sporulation protein YqfD [Lachnospiraceae bacterium]
MKKGVLNRLLSSMRGYVEFRLDGSNAERFLNLCRNHGIMLYDIERCGAVYEAKTEAASYFALRPIIKKTGMCPQIVGKYGFPFFLRRNRKRKILLAVAILFITLLFYLSGFLWRIEYEGCYYHTREQLSAFLTELGVREGMKKRQADASGIEEAIRSRFTDIGWVSVEIIGTKMSIRINETRMPTLVTEQAYSGIGELWEAEEGHIVAASDGIVSEIIALKGIPMVKAGDIVRKGDVLISGVITVAGDDGMAVNRYPVLAKGEITLKTVKEYRDDFAMQYQKKIYTGKEKKGYQLQAFGRKIFSYTPSNSYKECDIINEISQYCLWDDFYLPLTKKEQLFREYRYEAAVYTKEEAKLLADEHLLRYLEEQKKLGAVILASEVETQFTGKRCVTTGEIQLLETAWQYQAIIPDEWRLENGNEYNTNND